MLEVVLEWHPGAAQVRLSVEAGNRKSVAFYHRHGFTVVGGQVEDGRCLLQVEKLLR